ncbi:methyltransferase-like protein isoform X2 [Teleopsis dalmanni]|uniref:methyltransferase-like protein isoform X2 n=1 Tax=Teleopsis dalmanni TaxID=139649 RepID=UPI0018CE2868|nr:methyltransferase-like protein isoform X2 [Teleopsis dalmanni]XP_037933934.1 methyltransferase-like protein isoform X2 [Teleopsis dalmanni]XP_037934074.1 methyltransferase-like protein isoform X2 [Teleopsis dalmanni]
MCDRLEQECSREVVDDKRPTFGNRFLTNDVDVYTHNAWDNVEWDEEQEQEARQAVLKNSTEKMSTENQLKYQQEADKFWDTFYDIHQNRFFKDRHWLFTEFPELAPQSNDKDINLAPRTIFELGCGVGNTILPILKYSKEPRLKVYGCDFSARAIEILQTHPEFDTGRCHVFVMDATSDKWTVPFEENSLDVIVLIFVLSAIEPARMQNVAQNCFKYLRPGGLVLFRDYGRYDMAQLRFKSGKCLQDNFYVRGDGTMVYFFTQEELRDLFCNAGFMEEQNVVDRRLQVNRGRMLKMYRVWIQKKFKKPVNNEE